uniref:MYND-type domain-containing protein n=1 Tax=Mycena chlorophos TaxID=658473 RepID=A0ABQ0LDX9_MYCCL|nr:predicted protein [Mycena chlorophos]
MEPFTPLKLYLPLEKFEKCGKCGSKDSLKLCAACNEQTYCSAVCQKDDWKNHKATCGKTDKIQLDSFHAFIAALCDAAHAHNTKPPHPAVRRQIVNAPNPGSRPVGFPDGTGANLVILGEKLGGDHLLSSRTWFPQALTDKVRSKMFRRITREGMVLPIVMAVSLAILTEFYTTTAGPDKRRTRLAYKSSPISDFGIVAGEADVKPQDRLAYWDISDPEDMTLYPGQDPNDHYWLYFKTIRGETVLIDCAMFTFNMCTMVNVEPYLVYPMPPLQWSPIYFRGRELDQATPPLYKKERVRMSVLRSPELRRLMETDNPRGYHDPEVDIVRGFMKKLAGREVPTDSDEIEFLFPVLIHQRIALANLIRQRKWESWPKNGPDFAIEADPQEVIMTGELEDEEAWAKYLRKFKKIKKAGGDREELNDAFRKWQAKQDKQRRSKT